MGRGTAGSLVVSLGLDAAEYTKGLTKAEYDARKFGEEIGSAIRTGAIAGFAALTTASVAAFAIMNRQIEQIASFKGLSEQIGDSASAVQGLKLASDISGVSLEAVGSASAKLTSTLAKTDDEAKGAGAAIKALGLNLDDFKKLTPTEQLRTAAEALSGFDEGASKTAVSIALFGKSGKEMISFLNDLADAGTSNYRLTNEQITAVDEHTKAQAKLKSEIESLLNVVVAESVPVLDTFTGALKDSAIQMLGLGGSAKELGANGEIRKFAEDAIKALAFVVDAGDGVVRTFQVIGKSIGAAAAAAVAVSQGELGQAKAIIAAGIDDVESVLQRELFSSKLQRRLDEQKRLAAQKSIEDRGFNPNAKQLNYSGVVPKKASADDPTKKELDNALKTFEQGRKQEEDILKARNKMLDLYNGENLLSIQDYYSGRRVALEDNVAKEAAIYDKEIEKLKAFQASAAKATDREDAQGKINDLVEKKAKLYRDAGEAALEMGFKEAKAVEDLQKQVNAINADVLELTGNLSAASKIRLDAQYDDLTKKLTANGDTAGLAQLERLKQLKTAQADISQQTEGIARINANLKIEEDRIAISRQIGADTELTSLKRIGDARSGAVAQLEAYVQAQEAIARLSGNDKFLQNAAQARVELEKLRAVADPLGDKLSSIFEESFGSAFADFITGTKTASEAFQAFGRAVISQLAQIAAQEAATALFGKSSSSSSGGLFKSLFSAVGSYFTGGSSGLNYFTASDNYNALGAIDGARAAGGPVSANGLYEVNERGPEVLDVAGRSYLMMGGQSGRVTANGGGARDTAISVVNQTTGRVDNVVEQRISPTERVLILQEARKAVWSELSDRNSMGSKALSRNYRNLERV